MRITFYLVFYISFFSITAQASEAESCRDLVGQWQARSQNHLYTLIISPSSEVCGLGCVVLNAKYQLDNTHINKMYCHEGREGMKGKGPMVIAFEGLYGGHAIGTYNRQLNLLWTGVIPKDDDGKWVKDVEGYWFARVATQS